MPLIITIRDLDSGASTRFESELSPVRIGRNALNELVLEAGFVSQFHGVMRFDDVGIQYKDLGSTNGSTLAGQRLARNTEVPLDPRSDLRIGPLRLEAEVRGPSGVGARTPPGKPGTRHVRTLYGLLRQPDAEAPVGEPGYPTGPVPSASASASAAPAGRRAAEERAPSETQRIARGLAGRLLPPGREPATEAEARRLIDAVAVILDAFAHSFVGLRRGVEQTGAELGIRTVPNRSPLYLAKDHVQLLAHLLDPAREPQQAAEELVGVFADFGIHQVALLNGITESVKALLSRIAGREPGATRGARGKRWRFGGDARKGEATIRELLEDDRHLHAAIFGEEFGLAYAAGTLGGHQKEKP
jgi:predicted component of type VI protein secretion system